MVDGDTIKIRTDDGSNETVRLVGIDTPESKRPQTPVECGAKRAAATLTRLLTGKRVTLRRDPTQAAIDRYGRTLAYVDLGGRDAGETMVRAGWATPYVYGGVPFERVEGLSQGRIRRTRSPRRRPRRLRGRLSPRRRPTPDRSPDGHGHRTRGCSGKPVQSEPCAAGTPSNAPHSTSPNPESGSPLAVETLAANADAGLDFERACAGRPFPALVARRQRPQRAQPAAEAEALGQRAAQGLRPERGGGSGAGA